MRKVDNYSKASIPFVRVLIDYTRISSRLKRHQSFRWIKWFMNNLLPGRKMAKLASLFFVIFVTSVELCRSSHGLGCPREQEDALLEFKDALEGHRVGTYAFNPSVFSWKRDRDCCKWSGVTCRSADIVGLVLEEAMWKSHFSSEALKPLFRLQSLTALKISNFPFTGSIPGKGFANLTRLASLRLENNSFTDTIPSEIGNLTELRELSLRGNHLRGKIPRWIRNLDNLETLSLDSNSLSGDLPRELFELKNLKDLDLGANDLVLNDGELASVRSNLFRLNMTSCNISGHLPLWLSEQPNLKELDFSENNLEGRFPEWLAELQLRSLFLSGNKLSGSLPSRLFQSRELQDLLLQGNELSGELPLSIGEAIGLVNLDLSGNRFSGSVPNTVSRLPLLHSLDLSNNTFSGLLPTFSSKLAYIDLSSNGFTGEFPEAILETVIILKLAKNALTGTLPSNLNSSSSQWQISQLDLQDNDITGEIPTALSLLSQLQFLNLRNNSLTGPIPCSLSNLTQLQILDLSENNLTGEIPSCVGNFTGMIMKPSRNRQKINIPGNENNHAGEMEVSWKDTKQDLPADKMDMYTLLDLSSNHLTSKVPDSLGRLTGLKTLNISSNKLSGPIPNTLGNLSVLESLDLSNNNFTGQIPQSFTSLASLTWLDLSNNNLSGRIPSGPQMNTFNDPNRFAGNNGLCGPQIQVPCEGDSEEPNTKEHQAEETSWLSWRMAYTGYVLGFIAMVLITHFGNVLGDTEARVLSLLQTGYGKSVSGFLGISRS